ncbi:chemotaxis protein CheW [uncultured Desulfovibrio sp.]|uniref:Chemotaxis protein CheW n=1 Tax=Candidatus Desulfovibrio intestinavium TaxID=2838534 RepID=A0A9D2HJZ0_9BACT|nr:chemotaxis protein CheW [uncultured Desulfovibrio sp.]HJA78351.1 chemotaxis protein CheW [Candidatus Desulfovibrio intestinavium]
MNSDDHSPTGMVQFGTFYLEGQLFGVDILRMREILLPQAMTQVPRATREMEGVINLRGQVIPVISLRQRLGIPRRPFDKRTRIINMEIDGMVVGFLVDAIGHVHRYARREINEPPVLYGGVETEAITGMVITEQGMLMVLDTARLISLDSLRNALDG